MTRYLFIFLNFYLVSLVIGKGSVEDECYMKVKNELEFIVSTHQPPTNFTIPVYFEKINDLLNRLNEILLHIKDPKNVTDLQISIQNNINSTTIKAMMNGTELLKSISNELKQLKQITHKTMKACKASEKNFEILRNDLSEIEKLGKRINSTHDQFVLRINEINNNSLAIKINLDNIMVPEEYTCNMPLWNTLNDIIHISLKIKGSLTQLRGTILSKLQEIKSNMRDIEKPDIDLSDAPLVMGGPPKKLENDIDELKQKVEDLRERVELQKNTINWKNILKKFKKRLTNYIEHAQHLTQILNDRKSIEGELEKIKKIAGNLCRMKVCDVYRSVNVEGL